MFEIDRFPRSIPKSLLALGPKHLRELMKKKIVLALMAIALLAAAGCGPGKHHGYVSKYPCHKIHPCCH